MGIDQWKQSLQSSKEDGESKMKRLSENGISFRIETLQMKNAMNSLKKEIGLVKSVTISF